MFMDSRSDQVQDQVFERPCVNRLAADLSQFRSNEDLDFACPSSLPLEIVIDKRQSTERVHGVAHQHLLPPGVVPFGLGSGDKRCFRGGDKS